MRRLLIENARHRNSQKAGGQWQRIELADVPGTDQSSDELLALNEALDLLEAQHPRKAQVVKLRYFLGMTVREAAQALGVSTATVDNDWAYAKSWLKIQLSPSGHDARDSTAEPET